MKAAPTAHEDSSSQAPSEQLPPPAGTPPTGGGLSVVVVVGAEVVEVEDEVGASLVVVDSDDVHVISSVKPIDATLSGPKRRVTTVGPVATNVWPATWKDADSMSKKVIGPTRRSLPS